MIKSNKYYTQGFEYLPELILDSKQANIRNYK